jgi:hypothetical protein
MGRCNAYGAENPGGQGVAFGGFLNQGITTQPECHADGVHRFRWVCEHGHAGPIVILCEWHYGEFSGQRSARFAGGEGAQREHNGQVMTVPWNMRRDVQSCPRCASQAPECRNPEHAAFYRGRPGTCGCQQHKCQVRLVTVS